MSAPHGLGSRETVYRHLFEGEPATFVQMARGLHLRHGALRLDDLAPSTIWILHPSSELVGQFSTGEFLDLWCVLYDAPRNRAPRARLTLLDPDAQLLGDPVLLVSSPRISGSGLTYDVKVLSGVIPEDSGSCVLFIDSPFREPRTDDTREA